MNATIPGDATTGSPPRPSRREEAARLHSGTMSAGLARNWWAMGVRGIAAILFGLAILLLPPPTLASLVLLFGAYVAADGAFAIVAAVRAARRGARWWMLIFEGLINLGVAGAVLVWPLIAAVPPFVPLTSAWAIVTGALMLAAAHRLAGPYGRWFLALGGAVSVAWGILLAAAGPLPGGGSQATGRWLAGYALAFGVALLFVAFYLKRRHRDAGAPVAGVS